MSQIIIAAAINIIVNVLPLIGVQIGSDSATTTVNSIVAIITGVWIWIRRVQAGDVNVAGVRK